jgi:hypothetical protein
MPPIAAGPWRTICRTTVGISKRLFGLSSGYNRDVHLFEEWLGSPENQAFFEPEAG